MYVTIPHTEGVSSYISNINMWKTDGSMNRKLQKLEEIFVVSYSHMTVHVLRLCIAKVQLSPMKVRARFWNLRLQRVLLTRVKPFQHSCFWSVLFPYSGAGGLISSSLTNKISRYWMYCTLKDLKVFQWKIRHLSIQHMAVVFTSNSQSNKLTQFTALLSTMCNCLHMCKSLVDEI